MKFYQRLTSLLTLSIFSTFSSYATDATDPLQNNNIQSSFPSFFPQQTGLNTEILEDETVFVPSEEVRSNFLWEEGLILDHSSKQMHGEEGFDPLFGLSIDGGGMRGLIPAIQLKILKEKLVEEGSTDSLSKVFDYIGGTSIGGIVGLAIAADLNPEDIVKLFTENGDKIFPPLSWKVKFKTLGGVIGSKYPPGPLEGLLQEKFGEMTMGDLSTPTLVTACTTTGKPILFKSVSDEHKIHKVWEIARATSAAPTYFPAYSLKTENNQNYYIDGGMWINNPVTHVLMSMVKDLHESKFSPSNLYMLSLGTGDMPLDTILNNDAGFSSAQTIISLLMGSNSKGNHEMMESLLSNNYSRVNPFFIGKNIDLSDTAEETLSLLTENAQNTLSRYTLGEFVRKHLGKKDYYRQR